MLDNGDEISGRKPGKTTADAKNQRIEWSNPPRVRST